MNDQTEVFEFLASVEAYSPRPEAVDRIETHGAVVFMAGDIALKVKKAVRFDYLDFSTLERRESACRHELERNQANAPGIYLDAVPIRRGADGKLVIGAGDGMVVEWAVRMRRFPQSDLLSRIAETRAVDPGLARALAAMVATAHAAALPVPVATPGDRLHAIVESIASAARNGGPQKVDAGKALCRLMRAQIDAHAALIATRAVGGVTRRVHGDMHLGNIVMWNGQPTLFDAIEFDDALATIDIFYDLAFLLMDLDHRGLRSAANTVLNRYLMVVRDEDQWSGLALLPLFMSLRAGVRMMVELQRAAQQAGDGAIRLFDQAGRYAARAAAYLSPEPPRLVVVAGLSGTGKSTLAAGLAPLLGRAPGAVHLRSDVERKHLFGKSETERLPSSAYSADVTANVYRALCRQAEAVLAAGHSVVVDAVYARPQERAAIEEVASRAGVVCEALWLQADADVMRSRVAARTGDASDATPETVDLQLALDVGPNVWRKIDASGGPGETLLAAKAALAVGD